MISIIQILRFMHPELYLEVPGMSVFTPIINLMKSLNDGKIRSELPSFNDTLQHDALEFFSNPENKIRRRIYMQVHINI